MGNRNTYIDILKGIGILSVVVGHAFYRASREYNIAYIIKNFVYIYHLIIFFWASSCLYRPRKCNEYIRKLWKNYKKYVSIALLSYFLLPVWYYFDVFNRITFHEILYQVAHILLFQVTRGVFTGPMWFVTWFIVAQTIFYIIDKVFNEKYLVGKGIIYMSLGALGFLMSYKGWLVHFYYMDRALIVQPIMFIGSLCKNAKPTLKQSYIICPFSAVIIMTLNQITGFHVELSHSDLYGYWLFYPVVFIGILFCLSASHIIEASLLNPFFQKLGQYSFILMATHIMGFKLLDGILGKINNSITSEILHMYPTSFSNLIFCVLYSVVGVAFPLLLLSIVNRIRFRPGLT